MLYVSTTLATDFGSDPWQVRLIRVLLFFIPRANPDNERLYRFVRKWYLELDDSSVPVREIGIGASGEVLFCAPDARNCGFWTDSSQKFSENRLTQISAAEFETMWKQAGNGKAALSH